MKKTTIKAPTPIRQLAFARDPLEVLPAFHTKMTPPNPAVLLGVKVHADIATFALVDLIAEDLKLSKGKARKAIMRGKVLVNDVIESDPDRRVSGTDKVMFKP